MSARGQERRIGAVRNISDLPPRADVGADIVEPPVRANRGHSRRSPNGVYGISLAHCTLIVAARIPLRRFSVSSATTLPKSAGDPVLMRNPRSSYFALISGRARDALISLLSTSTISAGIFLGPATPSQLSNA